jgi:hypothetical protein
VRSFLREQGTRSPPVRQLFETVPEMFSSSETMTYLLQLAESRKRRKGSAA